MESSSQHSQQMNDPFICDIKFAPADAGNDGESDEQTQMEESEVKLSKNALKRLRRKEKFDKAKAYKRKQEREKRKQRHAEAREKGVTLGPSRKALKLNRMSDSSRSETLVIDCDFDDLMSERDIYKLVNQIQRCYSLNRRCSDPVQLHATSINGQTLKRLESVGDYKGWDVKFSEKHYTELYDMEKIVYLSSESENVLKELKSDEIYIIGGLVDHNHHKGLCHRLAEERGIRHARLPIDEYVKLQTRKVLTIDHVFHILIQFLYMGKWEEAFYHVIPKRKGVELIEDDKDNAYDENNKGETIDESKEEINDENSKTVDV